MIEWTGEKSAHASWREIIHRFYVPALLPFSVSIPHGPPPRAEATLSLDEGQAFQTMSGWEVTPFVAEPCTLHFGPLRDTMLALAVGEIGINRIQLEVRGGVENDTDHYQDWVANGCPEPPDSLHHVWRHNRYATVNDNDDPQVIDWAGFHYTELDNTIEKVILPMRALLDAQGESLHVNLNYVAFTGQLEGGGYHHDEPEECAEFVLATYLHMEQQYDFVPDTWEILLEPDNVPQWNGTLLDQAIVASAARLISHGFTPRFVAPSNSTMWQILGTFDDMVAVPGATDYLEEFSYHRYGADDAILAQIVDRALTYGLDTAMLEWWFGTATYEVLHKDLTLGRNSAWQGRALAGLFEIDDSDPENLIVEYAIDTMYNRQYFKFVRRGAVRIDATSDEGFCDPVAFINPDDRWVVIVNASQAGDFSVFGPPAGTYGIKYTTGDPSQPPIEYDVDLNDQVISAGDPLSTAIPEEGVVTIYRRSGGVDGTGCVALLAVCPRICDGRGASVASRSHHPAFPLLE